MRKPKSISNGALVASLLHAAIVILAAGFTQPAKAQEAREKDGAANPVATPLAASQPRSSETEYRIGPGDQLSIQVFNRAQLSREERVTMQGMIRMPLIDEEIRAACRTTMDLSEEIARLYRERDLLKNPAVFVSVKDFESQPVAVIGSVNSPGRFLLRRRIRLLELLVFHAGGPSSNAGRRIQVLSTIPRAPCESSGDQQEPQRAKAADAGDEGAMVTYELNELLSGKQEANPFVQQGDIINIPAAEQAFIIGNVVRPTAIPIVQTVTLGHALAMAGGTLPNTKKDKIRIVRETSAGSTEIFVDLKAVNKAQGIDFPLRAGDVVEVATKGGFSKVMRDLANSIVPTATSLPMRVVY
jgi:polysaccharide export outer membrane protein